MPIGQAVDKIVYGDIILIFISKWRPSAIRHLAFVIRVFGPFFHQEYLLAFVNVQHLAGFGSVVSTICKF